jgi:hypothetical protein
MPEGLKAVESALDRVASRMTPVIQNRALEAGWPDDVAASLSLIRTANGIGVHVDSAFRQVAADLEYGSASTTPRSALSTMYSPQTKKMMGSLARDSMDELIDRMKGMFS